MRNFLKFALPLAVVFSFVGSLPLLPTDFASSQTAQTIDSVMGGGGSVLPTGGQAGDRLDERRDAGFTSSGILPGGSNIGLTQPTAGGQVFFPIIPQQSTGGSSATTGSGATSGSGAGTTSAGSGVSTGGSSSGATGSGVFPGGTSLLNLFPSSPIPIEQVSPSPLSNTSGAPVVNSATSRCTQAQTAGTQNCNTVCATSGVTACQQCRTNVSTDYNECISATSGVSPITSGGSSNFASVDPQEDPNTFNSNTIKICLEKQGAADCRVCCGAVYGARIKACESYPTATERGACVKNNTGYQTQCERACDTGASSSNSASTGGGASSVVAPKYETVYVPADSKVYNFSTSPSKFPTAVSGGGTQTSGTQVPTSYFLSANTPVLRTKPTGANAQNYIPVQVVVNQPVSVSASALIDQIKRPDAEVQRLAAVVAEGPKTNLETSVGTIALPRSGVLDILLSGVKNILGIGSGGGSGIGGGAGGTGLTNNSNITGGGDNFSGLKACGAISSSDNSLGANGIASITGGTRVSGVGGTSSVAPQKCGGLCTDPGTSCALQDGQCACVPFTLPVPTTENQCPNKKVEKSTSKVVEVSGTKTIVVTRKGSDLECRDAQTTCVDTENNFSDRSYKVTTCTTSCSNDQTARQSVGEFRDSIQAAQDKLDEELDAELCKKAKDSAPVADVAATCASITCTADGKICPACGESVKVTAECSGNISTDYQLSGDPKNSSSVRITLTSKAKIPVKTEAVAGCGYKVPKEDTPTPPPAGGDGGNGNGSSGGGGGAAPSEDLTLPPTPTFWQKIAANLFPGGFSFSTTNEVTTAVLACKNASVTGNYNGYGEASYTSSEAYPSAKSPAGLAAHAAAKGQCEASIKADADEAVKACSSKCASANPGASCPASPDAPKLPVCQLTKSGNGQNANGSWFYSATYVANSTEQLSCNCGKAGGGAAGGSSTGGGTSGGGSTGGGTPTQPVTPGTTDKPKVSACGPVQVKSGDTTVLSVADLEKQVTEQVQLASQDKLGDETPASIISLYSAKLTCGEVVNACSAGKCSPRINIIDGKAAASCACGTPTPVPVGGSTSGGVATPPELTPSSSPATPPTASAPTVELPTSCKPRAGESLAGWLLRLLRGCKDLPTTSTPVAPATPTTPAVVSCDKSEAPKCGGTCSNGGTCSVKKYPTCNALTGEHNSTVDPASGYTQAEWDVILAASGDVCKGIEGKGVGNCACGAAPKLVTPPTTPSAGGGTTTPPPPVKPPATPPVSSSPAVCKYTYKYRVEIWTAANCGPCGPYKPAGSNTGTETIDSYLNRATNAGTRGDVTVDHHHIPDYNDTDSPLGSTPTFRVTMYKIADAGNDPSCAPGGTFVGNPKNPNGFDDIANAMVALFQAHK